jgi:hypothetical protein
VLGLRVRDAAEGRADVHRHAIGARRKPRTHLEAGIGDRQAARRQRELAEAVQLAGGARVHVVERLEVVDLRRDPGPERSRVESIDAPDRRHARAQPLPERRQASADGCHETHPRDPHAPRCASHVG